MAKPEDKAVQNGDDGASSPAPAADAPAAQGPAAAVPEPDYYGQLLRLKAEFENYRKRVDREKPEYIKLGRAEVLFRFLPIHDMLLKAHEDIQASHTDTPLAKGMEGIFKEFEKIFKDEGVEAMAPEGRRYDAMLHEVLGSVEKEGVEDGIVVDVIQTGFTLNGRALRPAKVRIAKPKTPAPQPPPASGERPAPPGTAVLNRQPAPADGTERPPAQGERRVSAPAPKGGGGEPSGAPEASQ